MILYPAIDLLDGKCVRLLRGDIGKATVFSNDPVEQVNTFSEQGFKWLHIVDLNGAIEGKIVHKELIQKMVPCAERVRLTNTGTETTMLGLRLARAFTGREKVLRINGHFHGWHDYSILGEGRGMGGVPEAAKSTMIVADPDLQNVEEILSKDKDIAAVILEPTGSSFGMVPIPEGFLEALREVTAKHGVLLIFDEVVTGFRVSPGGAQSHFNIKPDLTALAKILAGGLPGAAVVGGREILDALDFDAAPASGREKIQHQGTYNANPASAAAGAAALSIIESTDACKRANDYAERLRGRLNQIFVEEQVQWAAYGTFSGFHVFTNPMKRVIDPEKFDAASVDWKEIKSNPPGVSDRLRLAMLINGVDITGWPGGTISAAHDEADLDKTVDAFRESLRMLRSEDVI